MKLLYCIQLAAYNILSRGSRTLLTVLGVGISMSIIVAMIGVGYGLQDIVTYELSKSSSTKVVTVNTQQRQLKINEDIIKKISSIGGVYSIEEIQNLSGKLAYHGSAVVLPIYAVSAGFFDVANLSFTEGGASAFNNDETVPRPVIVNTVVLEAFGISNPSEVLNKEVEIDLSVPRELAPKMTQSQETHTGNKYLIVGIIDGEDSPFLYIPSNDLKTLGATNASQLKVVVDNTNAITDVRGPIEQMGLKTSNVRDTLDQVNQVFRVLRILLAIVGMITLFVAVLGTLNTITVSLMEQTREIGFLRIIGIKKDNVRTLFIAESVLLLLCGSFLGCILGIASGLFIRLGAGLLIQGMGSTSSTDIFRIPWLVIFGLLALSVVLGWVIGLGPAKRAVAIDPLEALRH